VGEELEVEERYYELCFIGYLNIYKKEYGITDQDTQYCFFNSVILGIMQIILIVIVYAQILQTDLFLDGSNSCVFARFIAMAILHYNVEPPFRRALHMMKYLLYHLHDFDNVFLPFLAVNI